MVVVFKLTGILLKMTTGRFLLRKNIFDLIGKQINGNYYNNNSNRRNDSTFNSTKSALLLQSLDRHLVYYQTQLGGREKIMKKFDNFVRDQIDLQRNYFSIKNIISSKSTKSFNLIRNYKSQVPTRTNVLTELSYYWK